MKRVIALTTASIVTAGLHLLFEVGATVFIGPFSQIYPLLKDLTRETAWTYLAVFIVQGLLFGLAYSLVESAFAGYGFWKRGILFGLLLWILSAVIPILPLHFLYQIGFRTDDLVSGIVSSCFLTQVMGVGFVASYQAVLHHLRSMRG
jgi:uncharacterized membrane protein YagU involved in acid resistance